MPPRRDTFGSGSAWAFLSATFIRSSWTTPRVRAISARSIIPPSNAPAEGFRPLCGSCRPCSGLGAAHEAHDAALRRPAHDGAADRVVGALQDAAGRDGHPLVVDPYLVVVADRPVFGRTTIGDVAARHAGLWLAQALKPWRQRWI